MMPLAEVTAARSELYAQIARLEEVNEQILILDEKRLREQDAVREAVRAFNQARREAVLELMLSQGQGLCYWNLAFGRDKAHVVPESELLLCLHVDWRTHLAICTDCYAELVDERIKMVPGEVREIWSHLLLEKFLSATASHNPETATFDLAHQAGLPGPIVCYQALGAGWKVFDGSSELVEFSDQPLRIKPLSA